MTMWNKIISITLTIVLSGYGLAEPAPPTASATPANTTRSAPLELDQVVPQLEQSRDFLEVLRKQAAAPAGAVTELERDVSLSSRLLSQRLLEITNPADISRLEGEWRGLESRLRNLRELLEQAQQEVSQHQAEAERLSHLWGLPTQSLTLDLPDPLRREVVDVRTQLQEALKGLESQQAELLLLSNRLSALRTSVELRSAEVASARRERVSRLLTVEQSPLWSADFRPLQPAQLSRGLAATINSERLALQAYALAHAQGFLMHLVSLGLLFVGLKLGRRRIEGWAEEEACLEPSAQVLQRPAYTALLLSVLLSGWFYPKPVAFLRAGLAAATLVPAVLVLRRLVPRALHRVLYLLVLLFFIDQLRALVGAQELLARLILTGELGAVLVFLVRTSPETLWAGRLRNAAFVVFGLCLAAVVLGFASLGISLSNAALNSLYLGAFLSTMTQVVDAFTLLALRSRPLILLHAVRQQEARLRRGAQRAVRFLAGLFWCWQSLGYLGIRSTLTENLMTPLEWNLRLGALAVTPGGILGLLVAIWLSLQVSRTARYVMLSDVYPYLGVGTGASYAFNTVVHYAMLLAGLLIGITAVGVDTTQFTMLVSALGVGIGFGLQNIVNNFVSGLILLFERPVEVGDTIEVSGQMGRLKRIGLRASVVRTSEGSDVIVPNGELLSHQLTNWTLSDRQRMLKIPVGVAYGSSVEVVMQTLLRLAREHPRVLEDPAPSILFLNLGESSLDFELRAWTADFENWMQTRSDLVQGIYSSLLEAGVEIPFPTRTLQLSGALNLTGSN